MNGAGCACNEGESRAKIAYQLQKFRVYLHSVLEFSRLKATGFGRGIGTHAEFLLFPAVAWSGGIMIYKLCAVCSRYFQGEMNGDYTCPECRAKGVEAARPLTSLDSLLQPMASGARDRAA